MPMETFVICVGDLATLRRVRAGPDLRLFSPWTVFSFFCFVPDTLVGSKAESAGYVMDGLGFGR